MRCGPPWNRTSRGLGADLVVTESEEEAIAATRDAVARGYEIVVAAGGDGTVGTVACELLGKETALGILPLGSVMNVARMLDIPRDLEGAAAIIATGEVRTIDVGEAKGQIFFEGGSVGLNAAVFREAQQADSDSGRYRALWAALWVLLRYRPPRMVLHLDDRVLTTRALAVAVANGPYSGLGFTVAPGRGDRRWQVRRRDLLPLLAHGADPALRLHRLRPAALLGQDRHLSHARGSASRGCIRFPAARMGTTWGPHRWSTWCAQAHCASSRRGITHSRVGATHVRLAIRVIMTASVRHTM